MKELELKIETKNIEDNLFLNEALEKLSKNDIDLNELSREQIKFISQNILYEELKEKMIIETEYKKYNDEEINEFIERFDSFYTKKDYNACLKRLIIWSSENNLKYFALKNDEADLFVRHLLSQNLANLTVLQIIKVCSSFYNWRIERKKSKIKNPFGKSSFKPKKINKKDIVIPTEEEIELIKKVSTPIEKLAIMICSEKGLRIGALPTLKLRPNKTHYSYISKGKKYSNLILGHKIEEFIFDHKIDVFEPFKDFGVNLHQKKIFRTCKKLFKYEKISYLFSYHSFRHYFAVKHYKNHKDIHLTSKELGHVSIITTEIYLKGLNVSIK